VVLTMDDLSLALGEHGVNVKKPDYCECRHSLRHVHLLIEA
jgi:transcription initiation factor TFIID subunit 10